VSQLALYKIYRSLVIGDIYRSFINDPEVDVLNLYKKELWTLLDGSFLDA